MTRLYEPTEPIGHAVRIGNVPIVRRAPDGLSPVTPSLRDTLLLRERALQATTVSVVITDLRLNDNPIVWVNAAFTQTTGYAAGDAIGRNPRFLQGADTDPGAAAELGGSIREARSSMVTLLNYRADGTPFWNSVSTAPVFDDDGVAIGFIGVQVDVTERVIAQREREESLREEHSARLVAEKAQRTLSLLSDVNDRLVATFDLAAAMGGLADLLVPRFADGCAIDLIGEGAAGSDQLERVAAASVNGHDEVSDPALIGRVLRTSRPVSVQDLADPEAQSLLVVPLTGRRGVLGALSLVSVGHVRSYDEEHLEIALDIARRAAVSIEWCRLYERERRVAALLQHSLLPELPQIPGLEIAAHYRIGGNDHQVGGDWYDLIPLPSRSVGIVVGSVATNAPLGRDLDAAAAMGRIRSVLRSYAYEIASPSEVLDRLDRLARELPASPSMTLWYGVLHPDDTLIHASAGHVPPLLRAPYGTAAFLSAGSSGRSALLGGTDSAPRAKFTDTLPPGASLVLYTSGLLEGRGRSFEEALERLSGAVEEAPADADPEALCSILLSAADTAESAEIPTERDDVALLILRSSRPAD